MKSLINAINNLANAVNRLADKKTNISYTNTSNPGYSNVKVKSTYIKEAEQETVRISKQEYDALTQIYNAYTYKGSHPDHHDHMIRELKTKWFTLYTALNNLSTARSYHSNYYKNSYMSSKFQDVWKKK